jgi:hypothetical protein
VSKCELGRRRLDVIELSDWCHALGLPLAQFALRLQSAVHGLGQTEIVSPDVCDNATRQSHRKNGARLKSRPLFLCGQMAELYLALVVFALVGHIQSSSKLALHEAPFAPPEAQKLTASNAKNCALHTDFHCSRKFCCFRNAIFAFPQTLLSPDTGSGVEGEYPCLNISLDIFKVTLIRSKTIEMSELAA